MANEGKYLNLKPHVTSWSIYNINGPYVTSSRIGTLAPSQFGGLSYQILEDKGNYIYIIQTESFGRVAIWAGDSDSTITDSPTYTNGASAPTGGTGLYVNLKPHVESWSIYNPNGPYVTSSRIGTLAPAQFGGLSYEIQGEKGNDVYLIQTESFGLVAIWAGDSDSTFTSVPTYLDPVNGGQGGGGTAGTGQYLNLHPHVTSWSIYNVNGPYVSSSRIGTLAPSQFGGLSYAILGSPTTDVYLIQTESFGQVAIWAGDSDSSITGNPTYAAGSYTGGSSGGTYVNLSPAVDSWSVYNVNGPYVTSSRIGTLAPSQFGGLSYRILESKGSDVYIIETESFGKVAIWAGDSDSTFTAYPIYMDGTGGFNYIQNAGYNISEIDFSKFTATVAPRSFWRANGIQWGGMDGQFTQPLKYIVIHHTAGADPQIGSDYEVMRGIQNYHQSLGWGDIGYHFCIGQQGTIMEGRPMPYVGAHVGKPHNFDSIGVSLFGNFMGHMPGTAQIQKLIPLLADLCVQYGISPDNILGHRDMDSNYGATSCPGDAFYFGTNQLAQIRSEVKKRIGSNPGDGTPYPSAGGTIEPENPLYSEPIKALERVDQVIKDNWVYLSQRGYSTKNKAIINYLRSYIYNSANYGSDSPIPEWFITLGPADSEVGVQSVVAQVPGLTPSILKYINEGFPFNYQGTPIDLPHFSATLLAHLQPTPFPDFWTGWGGDLATLMSDIIKSMEEGKTGTPQTISNGLMGGDSSFSRIDVLADIDSVGVANRLLSENKTDNFLAVFKNYFQTVTPTIRRKIILKDITGSETIPTLQNLSSKLEEKMVGSEGFDYGWGTIGNALRRKAQYRTDTKTINPTLEVIRAACNSFANYILYKL